MLGGGRSCLLSLCLLAASIGAGSTMKYGCDILQSKLCPCVRSQLKPSALLKGRPHRRGVVLARSQQRSKSLLFSSHLKKIQASGGLRRNITWVLEN